MSKYKVDHKALASNDLSSLREFDDQVQRNIQHQIETKRQEEEEARRKKARKKKRKRK